MGSGHPDGGDSAIELRIVQRQPLSGQGKCPKKSFWGNIWGDIAGVVSAAAGAVALYLTATEGSALAALIAGGIALAAGTIASILDWKHCLGHEHDQGACAGLILGLAGSAAGGPSIGLEAAGSGTAAKSAKWALSAIAAKLGLASLTVDGISVYTAPKHCT